MHTVTLRNAVLILGGIPCFILVCTLCYLALARRAKMRAYDDFLIPCTIFLGVVATVTASAYLLLTLSKDIGSAPVPLATLIPAATVIVAAFGIIFTFVTGSEVNTRNARQQLYQTLEIQSILLFRFESDKPGYVDSLWIADEPPKEGTVERYCVKEYICQILNLFEMAIRFQIQGVLPKDVFGSWVIWMWEFSQSKVFHHFWLSPDDLPFNYVRELRVIITEGVKLARECNCAKREAAQRKKFFDFVADSLKSSEIDEWFNKTDIEALEHLRQAR